MALSKNIAVLRALIEEALRRTRMGQQPSAEPGEVPVIVRILKQLVMDRQVFIMADVARIAEDFQRTTGITGRYVWSWEGVTSLHDAHVIVLHTGPRTPQQQRIYNEMMYILRERMHNHNIDFWHIGNWHG